MLQAQWEDLWQQSAHVERLARKLKISQRRESIRTDRFTSFVDPVIASCSATDDV